MLNRGGFANPDVLLVESESGERAVVKDYAPRGALVRGLLAPWLVTRELRILEGLEGVDGVPRALGRVDRLALAMEHIDGLPLRRRTHQGRLPAAFFGALAAILDELARRGFVYLDLRSPSNVLARPDGSPALVDLASALRLPVPAVVRRWLERRAIAKLQRRFLGASSAYAPAAPLHTLKVADTRVSWREAGPLRDPVPLLCLHDRDGTGADFEGWLRQAGERQRRVIAPDLPGFGDSRRDGRNPGATRVAAQLDAWLEAMRIDCIDVVAAGWGAEVAAALPPGRPVRHRMVLRDAARNEPLAWPAPGA